MIDEIHQSTLSQALKCPEQLRRRYIEMEIIPPSIAMGRGIGVHAANEANLKHKLVKGKDMPLDDVLDAARDGYVHAFEEAGNQVYLPKGDQPAKRRLMNEGLNDALRCAELYRHEVAPRINPIAIEEPFLISVLGIQRPLAGRMDYQELPLVGDLKSTTKKWAPHRIHEEIQPVFYSYVHEHERGVRPEFRYDILIARRGKDGNPTSTELQTQSLSPTTGHYRALFAKLQAFERMLDSGVFMPANPGAWWCSERWCGYWQTCPYVGNSKSKKWH
jgi:hypothetical protein